jgi:murein DD-endopeptidase MepM/ murein hydrolase activator NlpD
VALATFAAADALRCPHYFIAADGALSRLVLETRAAHHSGLAVFRSRVRNIDRLSVGVAVEHTPGSPWPDDVLTALHDLLEELFQRYALDFRAVVRWEAADQGGTGRRGALLPLDVPPAPVVIDFDDGLVFGSSGDPRDPGDFQCVPPDMPDDTLVLGGVPDVRADPQLAERFFFFVLQESYRHRSDGYNIDLAFHRFAPQQDFGPAVARLSNASNEVKFNGKGYGYQVFAGDTVFNEIPQWTAVQSLNALLNGKIPASGLARQLLAASFAALGQQLHPDWSFHQVAVAERLGAPLSNSYTVPIAGRDVNLQVFAGDTIYSFPPQWSTVMKLSTTAPGSLADGLWVETYKVSGSPFDPGSAFHQRATALKIGTPLTGPYQVPFEGSTYILQVFARDTLYSDLDGNVGRLSELRKPGAIANWRPARPEPTPDIQPIRRPVDHQPGAGSPDDALSDRRPVFTVLPVPGMPSFSQMYGYTKFSRRRPDLYSATQCRHSGLDFRVADGTPLIAVAYGVVLCAGQGCPFKANIPGSIVVRYGSVYAVYGHARKAFVKKGQLVKPGETIGESGTFNGPHLHFELRPVPRQLLGNRDPNQAIVNPGVALNPIGFFASQWTPFFEQMYTKLRGTEGEFCVGGLHDQPDTTFGGPLDQRPCTN